MEGDFNNHNGFFIINLLRIRAFRLVNIGCLWERLPGRDSFLIYTGDLIVSKTARTAVVISAAAVFSVNNESTIWLRLTPSL